MPTEMQHSRTESASHAPALPFLAEELAPDPAQTGEGTVFDAGSGPVFRWHRTSAPMPVRAHPQRGPGRRHEWWHVVEARPGAWLHLGLKRPASREQIRSAARDGSLPGLLRRIEPAVGDSFFIEAGTLHALGPGLTVIAVEEPAAPAGGLPPEEAILEPLPLAPLPGAQAPFRVTQEMLAPEQRVMLMDRQGCVAVVRGSGTFGNQPFAAAQCWRFRGPLPVRAIEPTLLILAEPQEDSAGRDLWRLRQ